MREGVHGHRKEASALEACPLEAAADLNHLDGGERSGYAYADPEDRLKHPGRLLSLPAPRSVALWPCQDNRQWCR